DTCTITNACRNFYGERHTLTDPSLAGTLPTWIGNDISEASAGWARFRCHHSTQDRIHGTGNLAGPTTCRTCFRMRTWFHRSTVATVTAHSSLNVNSLSAPDSSVFKTNIGSNLCVLSTTCTRHGPATATATEERFEDICEPTETATAKAGTAAVLVTCSIIVPTLISIG